MTVDFLMVLVLAILVIALLEWLKKPLAKAPTWVWWAAAPMAGLLLSWLSSHLPTWVTLGLLAFALATLAYDNLVQLVKRKIDKLDQSTG